MSVALRRKNNKKRSSAAIVFVDNVSEIIDQRTSTFGWNTCFLLECYCSNSRDFWIFMPISIAMRRRKRRKLPIEFFTEKGCPQMPWCEEFSGQFRNEKSLIFEKHVARWTDWFAPPITYHSSKKTETFCVQWISTISPQSIETLIEKL